MNSRTGVIIGVVVLAILIPVFYYVSFPKSSDFITTTTDDIMAGGTNCAQLFDRSVASNQRRNEVTERTIENLNTFYDNWCAHGIDEWLYRSTNHELAIHHNEAMKFWENVVHGKQECPVDSDPICTSAGFFDIHIMD
jgi:hypothetical protein